MLSRTDDPNLREYLTIGEAAAFLGVSPWTLRNWDRAGRLKPIRHPKNGYRIYRQEDLQAVLAVGAASGTLLEDYTPRLDWTQTGEREHVVQFYETDAFLVSAVSRYIAAALDAGDAGVVIATAAHLREIGRALVAREIDLDDARNESRLIALDAEETLERFMIDGTPDPARFEQVIGATIDRASGAGRRHVRAFGEMVALLWDRGDQAAAIQLEELWNELAQRRAFALCCAYPMHSFGGASDGEPFESVCAHHARVLPAESYGRLENADDRLREISQLQRKAQALEAEVAHRRQVEEELRKAKLAAEDASRAKDQFLAVLSHELRTPLAPVLMSVSAMQCEASLPPNVRDDLNMIGRNLALEAQLIDDLLDLSSLINGTTKLDACDVDVHPLIDNVAEIISADAKAKGLAVELDLGASAHRVRGDAGRLQQALWNLLKNAVKFTPAPGSITVRTRNHVPTSRLVVQVQDTGIGIDPQLLPSIFNAFDQGRYTEDRRMGGLGIGLAIAKAVVEMHGGRIDVRSEGPDRGACFTIELLLVGVVETSRPVPAAAPADREKPGALHILLVDDHADTLNVLQRLLQSFGHTVLAAGSVSDALSAVDANGRIDLLISDLGLPDGTGLDVMRRARLRHPTLPAIALTGFGMDKDIRSTEQAGFAAHLTKPIGIEVLEAAIQKVIGNGSASGHRDDD